MSVQTSGVRMRSHAQLLSHSRALRARLALALFSLEHTLLASERSRSLARHGSLSRSR
jgi:hypothetical protein